MALRFAVLLCRPCVPFVGLPLSFRVFRPLELLRYFWTVCLCGSFPFPSCRTTRSSKKRRRWSSRTSVFTPWSLHARYIDAELAGPRFWFRGSGFLFFTLPGFAAGVISGACARKGSISFSYCLLRPSRGRAAFTGVCCCNWFTLNSWLLLC